MLSIKKLDILKSPGLQVFQIVIFRDSFSFLLFISRMAIFRNQLYPLRPQLYWGQYSLGMKFWIWICLCHNGPPAQIWTKRQALHGMNLEASAAAAAFARPTSRLDVRRKICRRGWRVAVLGEGPPPWGPKMQPRPASFLSSLPTKGLTRSVRHGH